MTGGSTRTKVWHLMQKVTESDAGVVLTENAAQHVRQLQSKDPDAAGKPLRLCVEGGGCSGMQYGLLFDERRYDDLQSDCHGVVVVVDPVSAPQLRGVVIDYKEDLNDSGFRIQNPNARQSCGCGKSFC